MSELKGPYIAVYRAGRLMRCLLFEQLRGWLIDNCPAAPEGWAGKNWDSIGLIAKWKSFGFKFYNSPTSNPPITEKMFNKFKM